MTAGTSAMNALQLALNEWGFGRVVLAGVPLSGGYAAQFGEVWEREASKYRLRVRSMSGLTRKLFGRASAAFVGA